MIVLFNPLSTTPGKQPLPLSLMSLAAVLEASRETRGRSVDGNFVARSGGGDHRAAVGRRRGRRCRCWRSRVMPGPQLTQAVAVCRARPRRRCRTCRSCGAATSRRSTPTPCCARRFVDFVDPLAGRAGAAAADRGADVRRPAQRRRRPVVERERRSGGDSRPQPGAAAHDLDDLPDLPYHRVDMERYIHPNYLGARTVAHNSSFGCPFACSFCAVVAMSNRRWLAQSPARHGAGAAAPGRHLPDRRGPDARHGLLHLRGAHRGIRRAHRRLGLRWWALGRVDTLMQYSDATWEAMARSGLKMVFSGAESGTDAPLAQMNKGGKSSAALTLELARRMRSYGIVPEFSFVLGCPPDPPQGRRDDVRLHPPHQAGQSRRPRSCSTPTRRCRWTAALYTDATRLGFRVPRDARGVGVARMGAAVDAPRRRHSVDGSRAAASGAGSATSSACSTRSIRRSPIAG